MRCLLIAPMLAVLLMSCNTSQQTSSNTTPTSVEDMRAANEEFRATVQQMERRFPVPNIDTEANRLTYAREIHAQYVERRRARGLKELVQWEVDNDISYLTRRPAYLLEDAQRASRLSTRMANLTFISSLDARSVSPAEFTRLVAARVDSERPELRGEERRRAISELEAEVRPLVEERRRQAARDAALRREVELTRVAGTNLADMPREISRAAAENLRDARSPFDVRATWTPDPEVLRAEEVRLRTAIAQRMEDSARTAQANAQAAAHAARRDAVVQQCRMQAAMMGASVPSPYMGGGLGGILASGLVGAMRQAEMENNALQACLRASGY
jgi:hypothetical protein